jgi:hypothetical protein
VIAAFARSAVRSRLAVAALVVSAVALFGVDAARAQAPVTPRASGTTAGGTVALASIWADETHLGRGLAPAVEISMPLGPHVRAGLDAGWFHHARNAGYLAASGNVMHLMGRADLYLAPRAWTVRPFVGAAVGIARSTGALTLYTSGPRGALLATTRVPWTHTQIAWHLRAGTRVATSSRLAVRPEVSVGAFGTSDTAGALELPLLRLQGGVAVEWTLRR